MTMDWIKLVRRDAKTDAPCCTGDDVRVWFKITELGKERLAQFEGVVIRVRGAGASKSFTVRRLTHGEGVERVFPVDAPMVERVEVLRRGKTHRGRLYFLRRVVKHVRLETAQDKAAPAATGSSQPAATAEATPVRSHGTEAAGKPVSSEAPQS